MDIRCFISIEVPEPMRVIIGAVIEELKGSGAEVKWSGSDKVHITLKFLGDTDESRISVLQQSLSKKLSTYQPFCIRISGTRSFPPGKYPRVIWVGIEKSDTLNALQRDVEEEMTAAGYPAEERSFQPHVTIGRVRSSRRLAEVVKRLAESGNMAFGQFEASGIKLMKSELRPEGPVYTCLADIPFTYRQN